MRAPLALAPVLCALVAVASASEASNQSAAPSVTGVVNLNTATPEQLKMLPGVKDKAVAEIVAHRAKYPFSRPEELVKVKGFSKKRYERVKPFIAVHGNTTIRLAEKMLRKAVRAGERKLLKKRKNRAQ